MVVIDEAWHKVATAESAMHVAGLARQARHMNLFLVILTQILSDLETDHGMPLLRNVAMTILLRQDNEAELRVAQQVLGLSDETAALIANLQTVKGRYSEFLWLNGARGTGKLRLPVGPTEYWTFTSEPHNDVPMRNATIAAHDQNVLGSDPRARARRRPSRRRELTGSLCGEPGRQKHRHRGRGTCSAQRADRDARRICDPAHHDHRAPPRARPACHPASPQSANWPAVANGWRRSTGRRGAASKAKASQPPASTSGPPSRRTSSPSTRPSSRWAATSTFHQTRLVTTRSRSGRRTQVARSSASTSTSTTGAAAPTSSRGANEKSPSQRQRNRAPGTSSKKPR